MKSIAILAAAGSLAAAGIATTVPAGAATAGSHFEGTVLSVDRGARTFALRDTERGTLRIRVTSGTRFERVNGFAGLRSGLTGIEATVRRVGGAWIASSVQRSGGGGSHGGRSSSDDRGGRGRGTDDAAGDDHGRHGGGHS